MPESQADYMQALKGNQGSLRQHVQDSFEREPPTHTYTELSNDHGRVEKRQYTVFNDLKWIETASDWPSLQTLVQVNSEVFQKLTQKTTREARYYISGYCCGKGDNSSFA